MSWSKPIAAVLLWQARASQAFSQSDVSNVTSAWREAMVEKSNPEAVAELFCKDGQLIGTAGVGIRSHDYSTDGWGSLKKEDTTIQSYFDWFAKLPQQNITGYHDNIAEVVPGVWVNNAWVDWVWDGNPGLTARMTFVFRDGPEGLCISLLHSSQLPESSNYRRLGGSGGGAPPPPPPPPPPLLLPPRQGGGSGGLHGSMGGGGGSSPDAHAPDAVSESDSSPDQVAELIAAWMKAVVNKSNPKIVSSLFCQDGLLVATAGVGIRTQSRSYDGRGKWKADGTSIKSYFNWFAKLPDQNITKHHNNIVQVAPRVWINNAWVNWTWEGNPGLTARMTFVVREEPEGLCIFELHSSQLPAAASPAAEFEEGSGRLLGARHGKGRGGKGRHQGRGHKGMSSKMRLRQKSKSSKKGMKKTKEQHHKTSKWSREGPKKSTKQEKQEDRENIEQEDHGFTQQEMHSQLEQQESSQTKMGLFLV